MATQVYKLYASGTSGTTQDSAANINVRASGSIKALTLEIWGEGMDATDDSAQAEVSFLATNTFTTNDTRGSIAMLDSSTGFVTSGMANTVKHLALSGLDILVNEGERIYVHTKADAGVTPKVTAYLYIEERVSTRATRRT